MVVSTKNNILDASTQVLLFVHVCSQVVLLNKYNIALIAFDYSSVEVLMFLYVCPKVKFLDESNIALFAFR